MKGELDKNNPPREEEPVDHIDQAKQVLRAQAMAGMQEMMKRVAREVFEEEVRPLLEGMVKEAAQAIPETAERWGPEEEDEYQFTDGAGRPWYAKPEEVIASITHHEDGSCTVYPGDSLQPEPVPPIEPDPDLFSPLEEDPPEKKHRRWWK
jgi:hypothetical protein